MTSVSALAAKGHAFDHGPAAQRAQRLWRPGLGRDEHDDLALALGYPWLVELGPDADGDAKALTAERIAAPIWRPVPWPRNLAVKAARALAVGEAGLEDDGAWRPGEEVALLAALQQRPPAQWKHVFESMFLLEALAGGDATIRAILDTIEARFDDWLEFAPTRRTVVLAMGMMLERQSPSAAAPHRRRMEALLDRIRKFTNNSLPLRALDVVLNGGQGYERGVELDEHGRDRTDAFFLDRADWKRLAVPAKKPMPQVLPSVQWVLLGGVEELRHAGDPKKYDFKGSKKDAQLWVATQFARLQGPEVEAFVAKLTPAKKVKR